LRSIPDYIYEAAEVDRAFKVASILVDYSSDGAAFLDVGRVVSSH
jgi:ABC-type sugar transport system permease subunit